MKTLYAIVFFLSGTAFSVCFGNEKNAYSLHDFMRDNEIVFIGPWKESSGVCAAFQLSRDDDSDTFDNPQIAKIAFVSTTGIDCEKVSFDKYFLLSTNIPPRSIERGHEIYSRIIERQRSDNEYLLSALSNNSPYKNKIKEFTNFHLKSLIGGNEVSNNEYDYEIYFCPIEDPNYVYVAAVRIIGDSFEIENFDVSYAN